MSKATGVKGKTPDQLRRSQEALERQQRHQGLSVEQRLQELDDRPGESRRERARLASGD